GRLRLRQRGGVYLPYYLGHPVLVHTAAGDMRPGLLELPTGWDQPGFNFAAPELSRAPLWADVGAHSAADVASLGIAVGDSITVPKQYRKLLGSRATARSFDDRVGSAALIAAAWKLGASLPGRDITLAWTTGEEIGLVGAKAMAARLAAAGRAPDYVFAIDTFVSSDTPLEEHYMADTPIGDGFVIRAIDDSSITPWPLAQRLRVLAEQAHIPVQTGETSGGNDGSAFLRYGSVDLPMGWPLRTSHSPGEVIDTRDLDSLAHMIESLAHNW
ncbi:MAG TPA: M20/M25/M40 family metallo-hydrolase, partial [Terriglobales bacterium]|nr:M20/M25/M40 family metallo-hydrolase [Terriglobales bacterium]